MRDTTLDENRIKGDQNKTISSGVTFAEGPGQSIYSLLCVCSSLRSSFLGKTFERECSMPVSKNVRTTCFIVLLLGIALVGLLMMPRSRAQNLTSNQKMIKAMTYP